MSSTRGVALEVHEVSQGAIDALAQAERLRKSVGKGLEVALRPAAASEEIRGGIAHTLLELNDLIRDLRLLSLRLGQLEVDSRTASARVSVHEPRDLASEARHKYIYIYIYIYNIYICIYMNIALYMR